MRREILVPVLATISLALALQLVWSIVSGLFKLGPEQLSLKDAVAIVLSIAGAHKANQLIHPATTTHPVDESRKVGNLRPPFRLQTSFDSGLYGGLIGGSLAGAIIGPIYYIYNKSADVGFSIVLGVFVYSALVGTVFGAFSQLVISWFEYEVRERNYSEIIFNEVTGGIVGGGIAGVLTGALGGWFFGPLPAPMPSVQLLVLGSLSGTFCVILGILLYDYSGSLRNLVRVLFSSVIVSVVVSAVATPVMLLVLARLDVLERFFSTYDPVILAEGGSILGFAIAIVLGLQLGGTIRVYRLWKGAAAQKVRPGPDTSAEHRT